MPDDPPVGWNLLDNGNFDVNQRGAVLSNATYNAASGDANNDLAYHLDRWYLLSDGADRVDVSRETSSPPAGSLAFLKFTNTALQDEKAGIAQWMDEETSQALAGQRVSLSFQIKADTSYTAVAAVVMSWDQSGTEPPKEVVNAWGTGTSTDPTPATNVTFNNTPTDLTPTTSWVTHKIENVLIPTDAVNVGVFLYANHSANVTSGHTLGFGQVKLELGGEASAWWQKSFYEEFSRAQFFYQHWPTDTSQASEEFTPFVGIAQSTQVFECLYFHGRMYKQPTLSTNAASANTADHYLLNGFTVVNSSGYDTIAIGLQGDEYVTIDVNIGGTNLVAGEWYGIARDGTEDLFIALTAEIGT
jgi:hypothetical protein